MPWSFTQNILSAHKEKVINSSAFITCCSPEKQVFDCGYHCLLRQRACPGHGLNGISWIIHTTFNGKPTVYSISLYYDVKPQPLQRHNQSYQTFPALKSLPSFCTLNTMSNISAEYSYSLYRPPKCK